MTPEQRERYLRHVLLKEVGGQGQQKLLASRTLVVGAGGLGAPLIQYLAAAGVGTIGIADDDIVTRSNLQRQVIFATDDISAPKTGRAARAVARLNPGVRVIEHRLKIEEANARGVIDDYDLVVEGIDSFAGRYALNSACIALEKPLVSAAIGRFEGQVAVFKPWVGEKLPCYRCLVPEAPPREMQANCAEEGVLGPVAGVVGALAAMEVLKEILGLGESLAGRLLLYDGLTARTRSVRLPADPQCPECSGITRRVEK
ncbi:MAG: molybdopterin-synthase adenylyltransferase MoeB [Amphiplicatus sp.]